MRKKALSLVALASLTSALLLTAGSAHAQLTPGFGSAEIEHAYYTGAAGGALPVFALDDGQLLQPGNGFPGLGGLVVENDTGVVNGVPTFPAMAWGTPAGLGGTPFGGAFTNLFTVAGGGRAGIVSTNFSLADNGLPGAGISANTFGASVDFVNTTPFTLNFTVGHFMSLLGNINGGGFAAAGLQSIFEFGLGTGAGFVETDPEVVPGQLIMATDGLGGLVDVSANGVLNVNALGNFTYRGASTIPVFLVPGATIRMRGTLTLYGDPMSISFDNMPLTGFDLPDIGNGVSQNAGQILVPEANTLTMTLMGSAGLLGLTLLRRRKTTSA